MLKFSKMQLKEQLVNNKIKEEIRKYLEINEDIKHNFSKSMQNLFKR